MQQDMQKVESREYLSPETKSIKNLSWTSQPPEQRENNFPLKDFFPLKYFVTAARTDYKDTSYT